MKVDYVYPEGKAVEVWSDDVAQYSIVHCKRSYADHYCGYCRFASKPAKADGSSGILTYVPVHGGITYSEVEEDGSVVYGFDCNHLDDEKNPQLRDLDWLKGECIALARGILEAAKVEDRYLSATTPEERAAVLDGWHREMADMGLQFKLTNNFGAMIRALCGDL